MPFSLTGIDTLGISGGTDASKFLVNDAVGANFVVFESGNDNSHQDNEFVSQQMYLSFVEIYEQLLVDVIVIVKLGLKWLLIMMLGTPLLNLIISVQVLATD
jgi:hypothetical protein